MLCVVAFCILSAPFLSVNAYLAFTLLPVLTYLITDNLHSVSRQAKTMQTSFCSVPLPCCVDFITLLCSQCLAKYQTQVAR